MTKRILLVDYREDGEPGVEVTSVILTPPSVGKATYESIAEAADTLCFAGDWLLATIDANGGGATIEISTGPLA